MGSFSSQTTRWGAITMLPSLEIEVEAGSFKAESSMAASTWSEVIRASGSQ